MAHDDAGPQVHPEKFGIRIVDESGRGVPLVELKTTNEIRRVSDNAGWIAWQEPGLMNREVCWTVSGPGVERVKDGFGFAVFRAITQPGTSVVCRVKITNVATRIGRLTGQGLYRDSELLGLPVPVPNVAEPGIMGQDSVQCVPFQGKLFWLWGDTNIARYPLGNFHTTCATTSATAHPESGIQYDYLTNPADSNSLRKMFPTQEPGVVWMFGLMSLTDPRDGQERMFAGFSRRPGLAPPHEQGVAEFDPVAGCFKKAAGFAKDKQWGLPSGQAVRALTSEGDHFYFNHPFAYCRVAATPEAICMATSYEFFQWDASSGTWKWEPNCLPTTQADEAKLLIAGQMKPEQSRYQLTDASTGKEVELHTGSIVWNEYRRQFVLIGSQIARDREAPSMLGEIWYAEGKAITGPWGPAVKVASHPDYSFYNPVHHAHFDRAGGKQIYFEGTYTSMFSAAKFATAGYDYNQIVYRLDLDDPRLSGAHQKN